MLPIKQHTPGPWRLEHYENSVGEAGVRVVGANGATVCDDEPYYPRAVGEADARLIAVAPDLLAALEPFAAWLDNPTVPILAAIRPDEWDAVRAVMAMASPAR